ncbi:MAG: acyl-CoA/acyl-ACP dehydrogenase [Proteobacteria bacterium]|nr:acyl-CoA/acyl-ACP dehydrogenase [Pseudomonadota bacterium]
MNFGFTEEQDLLRREVRHYLGQRCPMKQVRQLMGTPEGYSPELWKEWGELGWLGITVPEEYGGAGLKWIDLVVLLEEAGRALYPSPLTSSALAGAALCDLGSPEQKREWLPSLADGSRIGTLALLEADGDLTPNGIQLRGEPDGDGFLLRGEKRFVTDPVSADLFVVAFRTGTGTGDADGDADLTLALVDADAPGVHARTFPTLDQTKRLGTLDLDGVRVAGDALLGEPGAAGSTLARLLDLGAVAVAAEMIGAAEAALDLTVQYAKQRVQFGSPIGRFQGVKHPLAEMYVQVESSKSLLYYAAWALDDDPEQVPRAASLAKAYLSDAFARIGIDGIQLHGTLGYTEEHDIQLYLKRSKWARPMFGDASYHYERVASLRGL